MVVGLAEGGATDPTPPTAATAATVTIIVIPILPAAGTITSPARCPPPAAIVQRKPGALSHPPVAIVAGGCPLAVQLLVRASRRRSLLQEAMQVRDALVDSACAYASMPPDKAETEGAWVWRRDAAAGGAGYDWATCLCLLERAAAAADVARDGVVLTAASLTRVGGCLS